MSASSFSLFGGSKKRQRAPISDTTTSVTSSSASSSTSGKVSIPSSSTSATSSSTTITQQAKMKKNVNNSKNFDSSCRSVSTISSAPVPRSFGAMGLAPWLRKAVEAMGITVPTPVQAGTIGRALEGDDIVACAQTGSGKTAAFALPILQHLSEDPYGIFAVVLTPSRELAFQISDQFSAFGAPIGVRVVTVTGGTDMVAQATAMHTGKPHIVVATPGRLAYHIKQGFTPPDFSKVKYLVLDECDRLLEDSFAPDLDPILEAMNKGRKGDTVANEEEEEEKEKSSITRQTMLYSATLSTAVRSKANLARLGVRRNHMHIFDSSGAAADLGNEDDEEEDSEDEEEEDEEDGDTLRASKKKKRSVIADKANKLAGDALLAPLTAPNLRQEYLFVPAAVKNAYLWQVLLSLGPADLTVASAESGSNSSADGGGGGRRTSKKQIKPKGKNGAAVGAGAGAATTGSSALAALLDEDDDENDGGGSSSSSSSVSNGARARSIMIFTGSCRAAQIVNEMCIELGIPSTALHSAMRQPQRLASLAKFKGGVVRVLVATDVASRGLDIPAVGLVINYDVPRVPSDYVHRVGRTARAGRGGRAVTIVTQYEVDMLHAIEASVLRGAKLAAVPKALVPEDVVLRRLTKVAAALYMARTRLAENGFDSMLELRQERKAEARLEREKEQQKGKVK